MKNGTKRPLRLVLMVRRDGITQGYHVAEHDREPEVSLGVDRLPASGNIPDDRLLRYASPRAVVNAVTRELHRRHPLPGSVRLRYLHTERKLEQYAREHGLNAAQVEKLTLTRAAFTGSDFLILPPLWADLGSPFMDARAKGARTLAHEHWHALKGYMGGEFHPLEEGGADLYGERTTRALLGGTPPFPTAYPDAMRAVLALEERFGTAWLMGSRRARDQHAYLSDALHSIEVDPVVRQEVLSYTAFQEQSSFRAALEDLLARERR
ncbi:hypothetical protein Dgeo_3079 (plasmid) [Deinococcus geothermalis DSM 11300]|uniref:Uncharacterized protein n=1 Tax=Deinococcus geothermalis (strain DSM 11300 / CIP 105573 / AG-3a) TaxID=319795 RepID=A8ZRL1_DEIGD|nr:hypothetical protein [Deinococcus geothermalis]ABW35120.1 hypothetical protein Dgeo_3079 [Deinococcus geothermalis DSM 11300]